MKLIVAEKYLDAKTVIHRFITFFQKNNHYLHESSPLISGENDTTMFTIAGMKQFTDIFLGLNNPDHTKVITIQPCLRVNDLDVIGHSSFHHTLFFMLGNFSFNDYFKENAIRLAYEFLFEDLKINLDFIYITVHTNDDISYNLWKSYINEDRIIKSDQNIWKAGNSGPCGYCSEIFFDRNLKNNVIDKNIVKSKIESSDQQFLEVWNLVFMEFQWQNNELNPLGRKSIDTGMGLERLCSIMNGSFNTYETDLLKPIMEACNYNNIIADHSRAILFLCSESLKLGSYGSSYILRKLIRRCFIYCSLETLTKTIEKAYEIYYEIYNYLDLNITITVINDEYNNFAPILKNAQIKINQLDIINEQSLYYLYETFGIPLEISIPIVKSMNININLEILEEFSELHKQKSNKNINIDFNIPTNIECYDKTELESEILYLHENILVTKSSCFYAKSGGQMGDRGEFITQFSKGKIIDTLKQPITEDKYIVLHIIKLETGKLNIGDKIKLIVNKAIRDGTTRAHSTVHIMGEIAMKLVNGTSAGSNVENDSFHFDIACELPLKPYLNTIIEKTNEIIRESIDTKIYFANRKELPNDILFLKTANYANSVRVIEFGNYSKQLCGGTHVKNTGAIGLVIITKETAVKKNVRRIYGLCGKLALEYLLNLQNIDKEQPKLEKLPKFEKIYSNFLLTNSLNDKEIIKNLENLDLPMAIIETETNTRFIINTEHKNCIQDLDLFITTFDLRGYKPMKFVRLGSTKILDIDLITDTLKK